MAFQTLLAMVAPSMGLILATQAVVFLTLMISKVRNCVVPAGVGLECATTQTTASQTLLAMVAPSTGLTGATQAVGFLTQMISSPLRCAVPVEVVAAVHLVPLQTHGAVHLVPLQTHGAEHLVSLQTHGAVHLAPRGARQPLRQTLGQPLRQPLRQPVPLQTHGAVHLVSLTLGQPLRQPLRQPVPLQTHGAVHLVSLQTHGAVHLVSLQTHGAAEGSR